MSDRKPIYLMSPALAWLTAFMVIPCLLILALAFFRRGIYGGVEYTFTLENIALVFGISLPVLLVLLFWLATVIPKMTVADPQFDLIPRYLLTVDGFVVGMSRREQWQNCATHPTLIGKQRDPRPFRETTGPATQRRQREPAGSARCGLPDARTHGRPRADHLRMHAGAPDCRCRYGLR